MADGIPRPRKIPDSRTVLGRMLIARQAANKTAFHIAKGMGLSHETIYSWERGRRAISSEHLEAYAALCRIKSKWILTGEGYAPPRLMRVRHIQADGTEYDPVSRRCSWGKPLT